MGFWNIFSSSFHSRVSWQPREKVSRLRSRWVCSLSDTILADKSQMSNISQTKYQKSSTKYHLLDLWQRSGRQKTKIPKSNSSWSPNPQFPRQVCSLCHRQWSNYRQLCQMSAQPVSKPGKGQMSDLRYKIPNKKSTLLFFLAFSSLFTLWQCWLGAVCIGIYSSLSNSQQTNLNRQHHSIFKFLLQLEIIFLENRWNMWSVAAFKLMKIYVVQEDHLQFL